MKKTVLIIGPRGSGKTTIALKITSGECTYFADPQEVIKNPSLKFIPEGTRNIVVEECMKLLDMPEKLKSAITLSEVNGEPSPEIILTTCLKKEDLPPYVLTDGRFTLIDLWSDTPTSQVL